MIQAENTTQTKSDAELGLSKVNTVACLRLPQLLLRILFAIRLPKVRYGPPTHIEYRTGAVCNH